jgi:Transglycosylase SLT domain
MGELKNPEVQKTMRLVCDSFGCSMEQLTALIQRESGGNPKARSESGSRGFMQLTGSVFQDMYRIAERQEDGTVKYRGRGIAEYLDNFQSIADPLLDRIRPKYPDFTSTIESIQDLGPRDQSKFSAYTRSLQKITYSSTAR